MPNKGMQWNELVNPPCGNPTKSTEINKLIGWIKKKETRKQGRSSKKRRPLHAKEVDYIFETVEKQNVGLKSFFTLTYFWCQISMTTQLDDTAKFRIDSFAVCSILSCYAIMTKLFWSKHVVTEENCSSKY